MCEHEFFWLGTDTGGNDQIRCNKCGVIKTVIDKPPVTGRIPTAIFLT